VTIAKIDRFFSGFARWIAYHAEGCFARKTRSGAASEVNDGANQHATDAI
jgi:hypothetical protein